MKARKIVHWRISGLPFLNASKVKIKVNIVVSGNGLVEEEDGGKSGSGGVLSSVLMVPMMLGDVLYFGF